MDEFKRLPWSIQDAGTNLEDCYNLNMTEYASTAIHDVFFNHLLEIDPIHYSRLGIDTQNEAKNALNTADKESTSEKFPDPRTGVEIPNYVCHHHSINRTRQNIFMKFHIQASQLNKKQQTACLHAMQCLSKNINDLTAEEKADRLIYDQTSKQRAIEKEMFLMRMREHILTTNSSRYHFVPPAIDSFVMQIWKQRLIGLHREFGDIHYGLSTALTLSSESMIVEAKLIHQESIGDVPAILNPDIQCVFQSCTNLLKTYQEYKSEKRIRLIQKKVKEKVGMHDIDFALPLSTLSLILCDETDWQFRMNVQESASSTIYEQRKRIILEKPLPPLYLSGNARYRKGAKYLLRSRFGRISKSNSSCEEKIAECTGDTSNPSQGFCEAKSLSHIEYKAIPFDDFMEKYNRNVQKSEDARENVKFSIFEVTGTSESGDTDNETFRVLISSKQDVYRQKSDGNSEFIYLAPKIEYQPEYGCEVMTKNELLREWCQLFFKPDTTVERVRFDYETGAIIYRQLIGFADIESELEQQGINRQAILNKLWSLLQKFSDFPVGDFLLQKSSKLADRIKVYQKQNQSSETVSLSGFFKDVTFDRNHFDEVHWLPIDDKIVTELHLKQQILPCAFPYKEFLKNYHVQPLPDQSNHEQKSNKTITMRKINVADDSGLIQKRNKMQKIARKKIISDKFVANKRKKNVRKSAKRKEKKAAIKNKNDELVQAKQNIISMADQYNNIDGTDLTKEFAIPTPSQSIASRTRQRSKTNAPEKDRLPKIQYTVRKSDRIIKPKQRIEI